MSYREAKKALLSRAILSVLASGIADSALSQVRPPDAGQILRETERPTPAQPTPAIPAPPLTAPSEPAATAAPDTARIGIVKGFKITGVTSIPVEELNAAVEPWLYRDITLAGLKEAADMITRMYRERGFPVARAFIPVQTMHDSIVEIAVLEGRLGAVTVNNASQLSDDRVSAMASQVRPDEAVNGPALERGLLLLQDTPGVGAVSAALQPGATVGSSDMVVSVERGPLVSGSVDVDNAGNRFSGEYRLGATVNLNNPLGIGDQLGVRLQGTNERQLYGRLSYRVPVGANGLMAGVGFSQSHYQLGGIFEPLDANGTARAANVFVTYPFIRSRTFNLSGSLSAEGRSLEDRIGSTSTAIDKSLRLLTASLVASAPFAGGGGYSAAAALSTGHLDIKSAEARMVDDATARSHGAFTKIAYSLSGVLPLAGSWSLLALANGQIANKNLDSSEKFSLGGADGVRAYPQGEATGDDGYLLTAELRYALPSSGPGTMQIGGFVDYGMIKINHNQFIAGDNTRRLSAFGVSFNWVMPNNFLIKASIARKLGSASAASDSDRSVRVWFQAVKAFEGF